MKTKPTFDVIIVGSGAGGGASAWSLARQGLQVLVLEAGPEYSAARDYPQTNADWELTPFPVKKSRRQKHTFGSSQKLPRKYRHLRSRNRVKGYTNPTSVRRFGGYSHVQGIGGSTLHFAGEAHRRHPASMRMKTDFGVGADWPIRYEDLEPYYCEAENLIGVAGPRQAQKDRYRSQPLPLPAHSQSYASQKIAAGCKKLGLNFEPNPVAILSKPYRGRPACNYCGACDRGCPRADKGSVDVTFIAEALATGKCTIKPNSPVTRIKTAKDDTISMVEYRSPDGATHSVKTRVLIIACGAIETPRLLLSSADNTSPQGLANENGAVGKNLLETSFFVSTGLHPEPLASRRGIVSDSICWDFSAPDAVKGLIGGSCFLPGVVSSALLGPVNYALRAVPGWGSRHKQAMRDQYGHALSISGVGESLPNPGSYVDLDPQIKDASGIPVARIHSYLDEMAFKRLDFMRSTSRKILAASGVEEIIEQYGSFDFFLSTHVFGTCRMGKNPDESVVDGYCRSHRWKNLFIIDASVFPSSGGGESPSLTIEAIALRSGAYIGRLMQSRSL